MKTSEYVPFENATEERKSWPKAVKLPEFVRLTNVMVRTTDKNIAAPFPSYSFPAAPTIPATPARSNLSPDVLTLTSGGGWYDAADGATATVTGGGGSGATVSLVLSEVNTGEWWVTGINVTAVGSGYTSAPTVAVTTTGGHTPPAQQAIITVGNWLLTGYTAWFQLGAYLCLLGATGKTRRLRWCAPGRPTMWDQWEQDGDILVLTGAGYVDLPGSGALTSGVALGSLGVLFDAEGIGVLALTGDWEAPFSYAKTLNGVIAKSDTRYLDGKVIFCGNDGRIWETNGYSVTPMEGPMNLSLISEIVWPPASTAASFGYNTETAHYVIHPFHATGNGSNIWVDRYTGAYSTANLDDSTKIVQTGVLQIEPESDRVHIQRLRLHWGVTGTFSGDVTVTAYIKGLYDSTWYPTSGTATQTKLSAAGNTEAEIPINYSTKLPMLKFVITTQTGATVNLYGMTLFFDSGGLREKVT